MLLRKVARKENERVKKKREETATSMESQKFFWLGN